MEQFSFHLLVPLSSIRACIAQISTEASEKLILERPFLPLSHRSGGCECEAWAESYFFASHDSQARHIDKEIDDGISLGDELSMESFAGSHQVSSSHAKYFGFPRFLISFRPHVR